MLTKKQIHIETMSNQLFGLIIGWSIVYFIFPLLQHLSIELLATYSSAIFFIASYFRTYIIRTFFNWYFHKNKKTKTIKNRACY